MKKLAILSLLICLVTAAGTAQAESSPENNRHSNQKVPASSPKIKKNKTKSPEINKTLLEEIARKMEPKATADKVIENATEKDASLFLETGIRMGKINETRTVKDVQQAAMDATEMSGEDLSPADIYSAEELLQAVREMSPQYPLSDAILIAKMLSILQ